MKENDNSITQFTDKYEKTNPLTQKLIDGFFTAITHLIKKTSIKNILEVGCGAGYSTEKIYHVCQPQSYHASDIDPKLVEMTQQRCNTVTTNTESIYELPHADGSFDMVLALEVFEHLEHPKQALAELKRVSNQYIIISVPWEPVWRILNLLRGKYITSLGNTPGHINHWTRKGFVDFINTEFEVVTVAKPLPWTMVLAKKK